jgi:glutathione peroxidase-family protein
MLNYCFTRIRVGDVDGPRNTSTNTQVLSKAEIGNICTGTYFSDFPNKPDGMRRPVSAGCDTLPMFDVLEAQEKETGDEED